MAYISKIQLPDGSIYDIKGATTYYATCSTAAATATKEITLSNFTLETGTRIIVTFTYENTAAAPSLSINEATAVSFYLNRGNAALWDAGETCEFIYDGTYWNLINYGKIEVIRL